MDLSSLDQSPGLEQQAEILRRFGLPVSFLPGCGLQEFFLVASVGRCKFRLSELVVANLLQVSLGGNAAAFKVSRLDDWVFKFSVSSKKVGFYIYNLRSYECEAFKILFHLWGNGGPQVDQEKNRWEREQEEEWTTVISRKKAKEKSFADAVKSNRVVKPLTGANRTPVPDNSSVPVQKVFNRIKNSMPVKTAKSVFERIKFPRTSVFDRIELPASGHDHSTQPVHASELSSDEQGENSGSDRRRNFEKFQTVGQNSGKPMGQVSPNVQGVFCTRCLRTNHSRQSCRSRIKCYNCSLWGHIAMHCRQKNISSSSHVNSHRSKGPNRTGSKVYRRKELQAPGIISLNPTQQVTDVNKSLQSKQTQPRDHLAPDSWLDLNLGCAPQLEAAAVATTTIANTVSTLVPSPPPTALVSPSPETVPTVVMAYNAADPTPFMPPGYAWLPLEGREYMSRAFTRRSSHNNDVAIVTIVPLPQQQVLFGNIRVVVADFLTIHMRILYRSIQPCHLGQAYVRLNSALDRDALVRHSPHHWEGADFYFVEHDHGRNHRRVQFAHECWLMLLGFPLDYWDRENIEAAIASFGRLMIWERDERHLARIVIKVRVVTLESVPRFLVVSDGDNFFGESWTVQCEIIEETMIDDDLQAEDLVPEVNNQPDPHEFDFFGFGQPVFGNENHDNHHVDDEGPFPNGQHGLHENAGIMQLDAAPAANENQPHGPELELNAQLPVGLQEQPIIDLNAPPNGQLNDGEFLEPQDLMNPNEQVNQEPNQELSFPEDSSQGSMNHDAEVLPDLNMLPPEQALMAPDHEHDAFVPEEVQQVDLVPDGVNQNDEQLQDNHFNLNLQVGIVQLFDTPEFDPVWEVFRQPEDYIGHNKGRQADEVRLWAKFLSPMGNGAIVDIPSDWTPFFTKVLLSPTHFDWARNFIASKAWDVFSSALAPMPTVPFMLPNECPSNAMPKCALSIIEDTQEINTGKNELSEDVTVDCFTPATNKLKIGSSSTTSAAHIKGKHRGNVAIVETDVRRSDRLRTRNKGFKQQSCADINCFACSTDPPTLSNNVIRKLRVNFGKVASEKLSDVALATKRKGAPSLKHTDDHVGIIGQRACSKKVISKKCTTKAKADKKPTSDQDDKQAKKKSKK
ncbi:hypothetical protein EJB05_31773, partial [Eragrostis curvula]